MTKKKILVIDDVPDSLLATTTYLESKGYNVLRANGGAEGLRIATQEHPDLILLDAVMPGMDGYEVLRNIKSRKLPTRVIMLTAHQEKENVVKFMREGACDFLAKDENPEQILFKIERALEIEKTIDYHEGDASQITEEAPDNSESLKICFVIMPIGKGEIYEEYLYRYEKIIKPAVEGFRIDGKRIYKSIRADFLSQTGSITRIVIEYLFTSDIVIADLSDLNPNVFYELGVRHALSNKTILIAQKGTQLPFDVGDLRIIFYQNKVGAEKKFIQELQALLLKFSNDPELVDSPVFQTIPKLSFSRNIEVKST